MDKARFLENLTKERKKRSLTQKELAAAIGVSDKTYSKWETGENEPDVETLCRLAAFYGVSPAVFFQGEGEKNELEGMPAAEAVQTCWRRMIDLLLSLRSCAYPPPGAPEEPLPIPERPQELQMPETESSVWHYNWREIFALAAAGPDMNLALLAMPHAEHYAWLHTEGAAMEELFRCLGQPGAVRCIYAMLTEAPESYFSPAYLAKRAGVTEAEAAEVLERGQKWQLTVPMPCVGREGTETLYHSVLRLDLLGLLSLGRLVLAGDWTRQEMRGIIQSGSGSLTIPKAGAV